MADITADMVRKLRERSGLPMMECKQALSETSGDGEKAYELLRKRGASAAEKKAGRATSEGRIGSYVDKAKGAAALVEVQCETAPVGNNPIFKEFADKLAKHVALAGQANIDNLSGEKFVDDGNITVNDLLNDAINRLRENMKIARVVRIAGRSGVYVHHTGKVGVILGIEGSGGDDALVNDVCMHVAAMQPQAVSRDEIPADRIAKEQEIAREQILASGKPANLVDKILVGKIDRWFSEQVLNEQAFVKDDKKTVGDILKSAGIKVTQFRRWQVGEA